MDETTPSWVNVRKRMRYYNIGRRGKAANRSIFVWRNTV